MTPTTVLVTGAAGFIGRHVVTHQLARGRKVRALDRNLDGLREAAERGAETVHGDIADPAVQREAVGNVDVVFHLASAHLERSLSEEAFRRVNVTAVATLLEHCREAGVSRFVHVSSCGVHGNLEHQPGDETSPFNPDVAYERTKLAGELLAREFGREKGIPVVVARPAWVYGPGCHRTARLFRSIARGRFVMIGQGNNRRGSVFISDFVDALELCATRDGVADDVFIVVHDEPVTVRMIVDEISRLVSKSRPRLGLPVWLAWLVAGAVEMSAGLVGRQPPVTRRSLKFFTNDAGFTCSKARRALGFEPRVPLRTGLERTYEWWRQTDGGG